MLGAEPVRRAVAAKAAGEPRPSHQTLAFGAGEVEALMKGPATPQPAPGPSGAAHLGEGTPSSIRSTQSLDVNAVLYGAPPPERPARPSEAPVPVANMRQTLSFDGPLVAPGAAPMAPVRATLPRTGVTPGGAAPSRLKTLVGEGDPDDPDDPLPGAKPLPLTRRRSDPGEIGRVSSPPEAAPVSAGDLRTATTLIDEAPVVPSAPRRQVTPAAFAATAIAVEAVPAPMPAPLMPQHVATAGASTVTPTDGERARVLGGLGAVGLLLGAGLMASSSALHGAVYGCVAVLLIVLSAVPSRPSTRAVLMLVPSLPTLAYVSLAVASMSRGEAALTTAFLGLVTAALGWSWANPLTRRWRVLYGLGALLALAWVIDESGLVLHETLLAPRVGAAALAVTLVAVSVVAVAKRRPVWGLALVSLWGFLFGASAALDHESVSAALASGFALAALPLVAGVNLGAVLSAYLDPPTERIG